VYHPAIVISEINMLVIGLMSGTSVDGIDAALVDISGGTGDTPLQVKLLAGETYAYKPELRSQILSVCDGAAMSMAALAQMDDAIAVAFSQAARSIAQGFTNINLIGSHGQTVFHRPPVRSGLVLGYSLQLGRGEVIAQLSQIETISNFRVADIALGGQGAPLVPPVDVALLSDEHQDRAIQNIGGMGNVAFLPARSRPGPFVGFDTGPGNMLLDLAVTQLTQGEKTYDADGAWAASGQPQAELVAQWLQHPFFQQAPPKSTGRELFGADYLQQCRSAAPDLSPADLLATLTDFTAQSIVTSYRSFLPRLPQEILICGGGARNRYLMARIQHHCPSAKVMTTTDRGVDADFKEAIAFAVLAYWRKQNVVSNLPEVTGAKRFTLLGEIHAVD
jgi:anhydro-N-acetylmuramic acid kinase